MAANARSLIANRGDLIHKLKSDGHTVHALIPDYDFLPEVEGLDISYDRIQLSRTGLSPLADLRTYQQLKRLIRKEKPDVVYAYSIKPVIYGSLASRACQTPVTAAMITGMGYLFTGETLRQRLLRRMAAFLYRRALKAANVIFFQNPDDLDLFYSLGIVNQNDNKKIVRTNGSGINLQRFSKSPPPIRPVHFLLIARLLRDKGIREFVRAAETVKKKSPETQFTVVGPHNPDLPHSLSKEEVSQWKKQNVVSFIGGRKDVRDELKSCSVYVLPSYREGTPRSVLEAMATGRAIITTDTPGCRETVIEGENGFLVPVQDAGVLAERMLWFLENPEKIEEMGDASHRLAKEKFDVNKVNEVILKTIFLNHQKENL